MVFSTNDLIIDIFEKMAEYTRIMDDKYRNLAYLKAIRSIKNYPKDIENAKEAFEIPGIGKGLARKIQDIIDTGTLGELEEMEKNPVIQGFKSLSQIHGFGPKLVQRLVKEDKIYSVDQLRNLVKKGKIKLNDVQLKGLKYADTMSERIPRAIMQAIEKKIMTALKSLKATAKPEIMGSYRRKAPTSGDIDLLISSNDKSMLLEVIKALVKAGLIVETLSLGSTKFEGVLQSSRGKYHKIDIRFLPPGSHAAAILYFTGSKSFNQYMRQIAKLRGYLLNEKGLFKRTKDKKTGKLKLVLIPTKTEKDIFNALEMKFVPPEQR